MRSVRFRVGVRVRVRIRVRVRVGVSIRGRAGSRGLLFIIGKFCHSCLHGTHASPSWVRDAGRD